MRTVLIVCNDSRAASSNEIAAFGKRGGKRRFFFSRGGFIIYRAREIGGCIRIPRWGSRLYLRVDRFPEGPWRNKSTTNIIILKLVAFVLIYM